MKYTPARVWRSYAQRVINSFATRLALSVSLSVRLAPCLGTTTPPSPGGTLRNKKTGQCKGVTKSGSKYRAKVWCTEQGKYKNVGTFDDEREAAAAVAAAEAGGTGNLPSPRPYVKRKFSLTHGAMLRARTTRSRPTDAPTDS